MLKEKSGKKRLPSTETSKEVTLDARHQQFVDNVVDKCATLEAKRAEREFALSNLTEWRQVIHETAQGGGPGGAGSGGNNTENKGSYNTAWSSNLYWSDQYQTLNKVIQRLESAEEEIEYYENTGEILFEYYNLLDKQDACMAPPVLQPTMPSSRAPLRGRKKHNVVVATRSILEALTGVAPAAANESPYQDTNTSFTARTAEAPNPDRQLGDRERPQGDKRALVEAYLSRVDPTFVPSNDSSAAIGCCPDCKIPFMTYLQEGIMVCTECGHQEIMLVEQNKPIHRQPTKETSHFSYKRINHFNEWLSQCQGQESTDISDEIFERILAEIRKEKIDVTRMTYYKIREILKKLKLNKYYEHGHYIIYRINGIPAPKFSQELEEKLRSMFKDIQAPFLKHCPIHRSNFLSYSFVLHKFLQLLGKDEFLNHFTLLKSREKLHQQDLVWRKICDELGWQFIQSV